MIILSPPDVKSWTIGANDDCDVVVTEATVSGRNCRITLDDGSYWIEDLQSTNGTFVEGVQIEHKRRVDRGDVIWPGAGATKPA